jgi:hypothetical protein
MNVPIPGPGPGAGHRPGRRVGRGSPGIRRVAARVVGRGSPDPALSPTEGLLIHEKATDEAAAPLLVPAPNTWGDPRRARAWRGRPSVGRTAGSETRAEHFDRRRKIGLETFGRADGGDPSGARRPAPNGDGRDGDLRRGPGTVGDAPGWREKCRINQVLRNWSGFFDDYLSVRSWSSVLRSPFPGTHR